jgi:UDP-3-O-[3-hydroxymyristoyl] glucosamine N-acyltransferase
MDNFKIRISNIQHNKIDQDFEIIRDGFFGCVLPIDQINNESDAMTFIEDDKYIIRLKNKSIAVIILGYNSNLIDSIDLNVGIITTSNPKKLFYLLHNLLTPQLINFELQPSEVSLSAKVSKLAAISDYGVVIGNNVVIGDFTVIQGPTIIDDNVVIGSNTTIGSDGFVFYRDGKSHFVVNSYGGIHIQSNVVIKNSVCIDKGVYGGFTIIEEGCKIDNLVHVGHDCYVGKQSILVAGTSIGGWTKIGQRSWLGINTTISNNIILGNDSKVFLGSTVARDFRDKSIVSGYFAEDHDKNLTTQIKIKRLK